MSTIEPHAWASASSFIQYSSSLACTRMGMGCRCPGERPRPSWATPGRARATDVCACGARLEYDKHLDRQSTRGLVPAQRDVEPRQGGGGASAVEGGAKLEAGARDTCVSRV